MKIGAIQAAGLSNYKSTKIQPAKKETPSLGSDKLEISESSRLFASALKAATEAPAERADKVASIRDQIAAGTYKANSAAIADKLLKGVAGTNE